MVTSVQLGNFFTSGGKTVLGGSGGSGIDTESLIKGLTDAKALPATKLQDTITANGKITDALTQFKTLVSAVKDAASFLRNPPGVGNQASNAFLYTTANVVSNTSVDASNYVGVSSSPGTAAGTYNISVITSVAAAKQQGTGDITGLADADTAFVTASATANRFTAGTVTINGTDITLDTGDTLNQVAAKFNTVSSSTGIKASVVKVSDGTFQLAFAATATGLDADFDLNSAGTVTAGASVFNGMAFGLRQDASNAVFTMNGVEITRQNNTVSDVVNGVTFNIKQATPALTTLTATVSADTTIVKNAVVNFINAYNDLKIFAAKQSQVDANGQYTADAVLANNSTFRNTMSSISNALSQVVAGITGSNPSRLSDVGVTFADLPESKDNPLVRNVLDLNDGALTTALANNFDAVRKVFEFNLDSTNPNLRVYSNTNALSVNNFALNVGAGTPPALPTVTATYTSGGGPVTVNLTVAAITDNTNGTVLGYTLTGQDGTALAGLKMIYASTAASSMSVTATQGLADKVFNISDGATSDTGTIATDVSAINSADTRLNDEITKINADVETYRQQLLDKFAQMEQAIAKVNNLLTSIDADNKARYASSSG